MVCRSLSAVAVLAVTLSAAGRCQADSRTYHGLSGDLKADVTFEQMGSDLKITLSNSSAKPVEKPEQVLTGDAAWRAEKQRISDRNEAAFKRGRERRAEEDSRAHAREAAAARKDRDELPTQPTRP